MFDNNELENKLLYCLDKKNVISLKENVLVNAKKYSSDAITKLTKYFK